MDLKLGSALSVYVAQLGCGKSCGNYRLDCTPPQHSLFQGSSILADTDNKQTLRSERGQLSLIMQAKILDVA